jgi:tRNA threonylcarbamoyl adenosine modification protein YeaZ
VIVAFSTSSPIASVALLSDDAEVLFAASEEAPMAASGACMRLLERGLCESHLELQEATLFLADLGPGSFTGVKVAVTLAKIFAFANSTLVAGASSFDLIDAVGTAVLPSKRGEFFVRRVGEDPIRQTELPEGDFTGYGAGVSTPTYPMAERFSQLLGCLTKMAPVVMLPNYLIEPSISTPKTPYGLKVQPGG